jgi:hypothetical protein
MNSRIFVGSCLLALPALGVAAPSVQAELNQWQAKASLAADRAEETAQQKKDREVLEGLPDTLAGKMLVPRVDRVSFKGSEDQLNANLQMSFSASTKLSAMMAALTSALGAVQGKGDTVCFSTEGGTPTRLAIPDGADHALLSALGTSHAALEPVPYIETMVGQNSVVLSSATLGKPLFQAIQSRTRENGSLGLSLEVDGTEVMATSDVPVKMQMSTTNGQQLRFPVELEGVPTSASRLPSQTVWRVSGVPGAIAYSGASPIHRRLASIFINNGRLTLTKMMPRVQYPSHTAEVNAGDFVVNYMGERRSWYSDTEFKVAGLMTVARTEGGCDIAVGFAGHPPWSSKATRPQGGPMTAQTWPKVKEFRIIRVGEEEVRLSYLNGPDCPPAEGGISDAAFDEVMTRPARCQQACIEAAPKRRLGSFVNRCNSDCMNSLGFRACLERASRSTYSKAALFGECIDRQPKLARSLAVAPPVVVPKPAPSIQPKPSPSAPSKNSTAMGINDPSAAALPLGAAPSRATGTKFKQGSIARTQRTKKPKSRPNQTVDVLQRACESGDGVRCNELALKYVRGAGIAKDPKKGLEFMRLGCVAKHGQSCFVAGQMYERGIGTKKDKSSAAEFFKKACDLQFQGAIDAGACGN